MLSARHISGLLYAFESECDRGSPLSSSDPRDPSQYRFIHRERRQFAL